MCPHFFFLQLVARGGRRACYHDELVKIFGYVHRAFLQRRLASCVEGSEWIGVRT